MPTLSVFNPHEVSSPQTLDVFLGDPPRHMLIFTGIANSRWDSRSDLDRETIIIKLGRTVAQPPTDGEWTAEVGLVNIANTESDFIFALDRVAALQVDSSGELQLVVDIAVQGNDSFLNAFSYQVTVLVQARDVGLKSLLVSDNVPLDDPNTALDPNAPSNSTLQWGPEATVDATKSWRLRVELDGPAPDPGVVVKITSDKFEVPVQGSVLVQPGHTNGGDELPSPATWDVDTNSALTAKILATHNGETRTALIHVKGPTA